MLNYALIFLVGVICRCSAQDLPVQIPLTVIEGGTEGSCPTSEALDQARNASRIAVQSGLLEAAAIRGDPICPCGGPGEWTKVADLDMRDPNQQCPTNWNLVTTPVRACGRLESSAGCNSATFAANGMTYSRVCGRVIAYQAGTPDALRPTFWHDPGLNGGYLYGLSLTHGAAGAREHIWSFLASRYEGATTDNNAQSACPCSNTEITWPYSDRIPSFIGDNYFCDTGERGPPENIIVVPDVYTDDPLFDGKGCGPTSTCCEFNTPPWFCTTLPQPTSDDLELRICMGDPDDDVYVEILDIYIM